MDLSTLAMETSVTFLAEMYPRAVAENVGSTKVVSVMFACAQMQQQYLVYLCLGLISRLVAGMVLFRYGFLLSRMNVQSKYT